LTAKLKNIIRFLARVFFLLLKTTRSLPQFNVLYLMKFMCCQSGVRILPTLRFQYLLPLITLIQFVCIIPHRLFKLFLHSIKFLMTRKCFRFNIIILTIGYSIQLPTYILFYHIIIYSMIFIIFIYTYNIIYCWYTNRRYPSSRFNGHNRWLPCTLLLYLSNNYNNEYNMFNIYNIIHTTIIINDFGHYYINTLSHWFDYDKINNI